MRCVRSVISERRGAALIGLLCASACGVVRSEQLGRPQCPDYELDVQPALQAGCERCHSGADPKGGYALSSYSQTLTPRGDGKARLVPGVSDSLFLQAARGELAGHAALDAEPLALVTDWAVRCRGGPKPFGWHAVGWLTPGDALASHGRYLRAGGEAQQKAYPFEECAECHGDDLKGGKSERSCYDCHTEGPKACNTCHGDATSAAPPRALSGARGTPYLGVGAHRTHVSGGALGQPLDCDTCHVKPVDVDDDGHYRNGEAPDVTLAGVRLSRGGPGGAAQWSHAEATCTNTACHAPSLNDTRASVRAPKWTRVGDGQAACGTCHGAPPSSHSDDDRCGVCHGGTYGRTTVDPALHLNFTVDVRGGGTGCSGCHAGPADAQFRDLLGLTTASLQTVGAHQAHLTGGRFRAGLSCGDCHRVPSSLRAVGHIDTAAPAEVFTTPSLASAFGASPSYSAANATCSGVYCHGAGSRAQRDTAPGKMTSPVWSGPSSQVVCGSCHGVPPQDGSPVHAGRTLADCAGCHGASVNADGGIRFTVDGSGKSVTTHLDGQISGNP